MTAYGSIELANAFRTVRKNTVQVAEDIPEDKYDFVPAPGVQSVSQMLRHIAHAPALHESMHGQNRVSTLKGFDFSVPFGKMKANEAKPLSKTEIIKMLNTDGERFAKWLESIPHEQLEEIVTDPTGSNPRTRLDFLLGAKEHEMHHRAQLMLVQRMIGVVPHLTRQREERQRAQAAAAASAKS